MDAISKNKPKKHVCIGLLAHVDAGKTTLSEAMLYESGMIRDKGRVDKGSAFLDTYELEKERGITIFSKQAVLSFQDWNITLLDTPGHIDFSAEMERTLQVLDYAVLVISAANGVQAHTRTLWKLLDRYHIPVFLFINKMDQPSTNQECVMKELKEKLDEGCIAFDSSSLTAGQYPQSFCESAALMDETLLDFFLETGSVAPEHIRELIGKRRLFPCFFGSALKGEGVKLFLQGISSHMIDRKYPEKFAARVFKISRDVQGNRLTYMKITGGTLRVKMLLPETEEKVNQIRIYSGEKYETVTEAQPGMVCAVTGLKNAAPGSVFGIEKPPVMPVLEPVLNYKIVLPEGTNAKQMLPKLKELEEEEPMLHIIWNEKLQEIQAKLMGEVQTEILKRLVQERFQTEISFGSRSIVYKETITDMVEGVGHFEPLRHYAEVHLILEPGESGSGLTFLSAVSEDELDRNWQRLILSHLNEKEYTGVLTGSPVTDMKITLAAGRAHKKHTEGGDFRQATYRAVRQGLMQACSVLLEPYYDVVIEVPEEHTGRVMSDMERMKGTFEAPSVSGGVCVLTGKVPAVNIQEYQQELNSYTRGLGQLTCVVRGYEACHNAEEVIEEKHYEPGADLENPADSVFCSHGAGVTVSWDKVKDAMHIESKLPEFQSRETVAAKEREPVERPVFYEEAWIDTEEVERILSRTYQANSKEKNSGKRRFTKEKVRAVPENFAKTTVKIREKRKEYLLVDGYNVIYAWEDLKELADENIDAARGKLLDAMSNYQGIRGGTLIVVFDAYRVQCHAEEMLPYHNIFVVYTKEAQTADQYIEKFAHDNRDRYEVTVATSDSMEQIITRSQGCHLLSARELKEESVRQHRELMEDYTSVERGGITRISDILYNKKDN